MLKLTNWEFKTTVLRVLMEKVDNLKEQMDNFKQKDENSKKE